MKFLQADVINNSNIGRLGRRRVLHSREADNTCYSVFIIRHPCAYTCIVKQGSSLEN